MTPSSGPSAPPAQKRECRRLLAAVATAAVLWFLMFSPWTSGCLNFWVAMAVSATVLTTLALCFRRPDSPGRINAGQVALGVVIALALWGVFWIGDKVSSWMFGFARPEVNAVYAMKEGLPSWLIGLLLLLLIGPAEEFFWRGYVQRTLGRLLAARRQADADTDPRARTVAFLVTLAIYTLIHLWSFNFMLIMAALVAGFVWGLIYRLRPQLLPALIISHALWDALVFVILPI